MIAVGILLAAAELLALLTFALCAVASGPRDDQGHGWE